MNFQNTGNLRKLTLAQADQNPRLIEHERAEEKHQAADLSAKLYVEGLPVQATSNDACEVVKFFKNKSQGLSFAEVLSSEPRRIFEPRKIDAYQHWGIMERAGERLRLTALGTKLASLVSSESYIFEEIILSVSIYVEIIKWIHQQKINLITISDINNFFREMQIESNEITFRISEAEVVSFFSLCHAAELGITTVGKRGQPTRLKIDPEKIEKFLKKNKFVFFSSGRKTDLPYLSEVSTKNHFIEQKDSVIKRVYISGAPETELINNLSDSLELADFEKIISQKSEQIDYLQTNRLQKMQLCQAGIIVISDQDCMLEKTEIKPESLTEITTALGLFNWRVIIIWNSVMPVPSHFEDYEMPLLIKTSDNFRISYQCVKLLKNMSN